MSLQDFMMRKLLQSKMKGIPQEEQEKILNMLQKNPELFQKIGMEIQSAVQGGKDQMIAARDVAEKYKEEIRKLQ